MEVGVGWGGEQREGRRGGKVMLGAQAKGKEGKFVLGGRGESFGG